MKIYRKSNSDDFTAFGAVLFVLMITVGPLLTFYAFYQNEEVEVTSIVKDGHHYKKFYDNKNGQCSIVHDPDCPCQKQK